ncbi:MAG: hypothetical protein WCD04_10205 [Terriglobia bacterium]
MIVIPLAYIVATCPPGRKVALAGCPERSVKVLVVVLEPGRPMPPPALRFLPAPGVGLLPSPVAGLLPSPVAGLLPSPVAGLLPSPAAGLLPSPAAGLLPSPVAGLLPNPVAGLLPSPVAGLLPSPVAGLLPSPVAGLLPSPVAGLLPSPVAGLLTTPVFGLLSPGAGRLGGDLGAGAAFTCGAGLEGALVFFWSPQASAEKIIRTKSTVEFFRILLFGMFSLLTISCSSESFLCAFTGQNVIELEIP